jgi:hypothetical protein
MIIIIVINNLSRIINMIIIDNISDNDDRQEYIDHDNNDIVYK